MEEIIDKYADYMPDDETITKQIARIRNLRNYMNYSEEALREKAIEGIRKKLSRKGDDAKADNNNFIVELPNRTFVQTQSKDEYDFVKSALDDLMSLADFTGHYADLYTLLSTKYRLFLLSRKEKSDNKDIELMSKLSTEIRNLQDSLGISRKQTQGSGGETPVEFWENMKNDASEFRKEHLYCFKYVCGFCGSVSVNDVPHFAFVHCTTPLNERNCLQCMDDSVPEQYRHLSFERRIKFRTNICGKKVWSQEVANMVRDKTLTVQQASRILQIAPIGLLIMAREREFDLGIEYDLNHPDSLEPFV